MRKSFRKEKLIMPSDESAFEQNLLKNYGDPIASYGGKGHLKKLINGQEVSCRFKAVQLRNGDVLLLCSFLENFPFLGSIGLCLDLGACNFEGVTPEGYIVIADEPIVPINYFPPTSFGSEPEITATGVFRLREMHVQMAENPVQANSVRFGVTNFKFASTDFPLSLRSAGRETNVIVSPVKQYTAIMNRIQTLKAIDVTCEVAGEVPETGGIERLKEIVDDLCCLVSVARGTKIQWVYCDQYNAKGKRVRRTHSSKVTKPYCPLPVIDPRVNAQQDTKTFIEQAYNAYVSKKDAYRLNRGTIDAYLDAKAENDYLETRGVKLAVAMEVLKTVYLDQPNSPTRVCVLDEEKFNNLVPLIKKKVDNVLQCEKIDKGSRDAICNEDKIKSLNRRSFRHIIDKLCKDMDLKVEEKDLQLFIACRNSLVHKGRFYRMTATKEEQEKCPPLDSKEHEYFFLVNFLDKIFLKLLGYSGAYIDWRMPSKPSRREKV